MTFNVRVDIPSWNYWGDQMTFLPSWTWLSPGLPTLVTILPMHDALRKLGAPERVQKPTRTINRMQWGSKWIWYLVKGQGDLFSTLKASDWGWCEKSKILNRCSSVILAKATHIPWYFGVGTHSHSRDPASREHDSAVMGLLLNWKHHELLQPTVINTRAPEIWRKEAGSWRRGGRENKLEHTV